MHKDLHVHYLEIVTPNVEQACASYSQSLGAVFSDVIPELGGAKTAQLSGDGLLGIRPPMHDAEEPATRPYYLVDDIENAINDAKKAGSEILLPPMEIPGRGICAIVANGAIQSGFWQI